MDASGASSLRSAARRVLDAALEAVAPGPRVAAALRDVPPEGRELVLLAVGKAAAPMADAAAGALGQRVRSGLAVIPRGTPPPHASGIEVVHAEHPEPGPGSLAAGARVVDLLSDLDPETGLLVLLSGGASSLLAAPPPGVPLEDLARTTGLLLRAGAPIQKLNCVRKHLDLLKGGRLAARAHPSPVTGLVVSDVVGDRLDVIGSGPLTGDPGTFADARAVLERRGVWDRVPASIRDHIEAGRAGRVLDSPAPGDPRLATTRVRVVARNRDAREAAARAAGDVGFDARLDASELEGEARRVGRDLARLARETLDRTPPRPVCHVLGGETTVTVTGTGSGGPNQEVALAAALALDGVEGVLVAALGTDGRDGPTDAAGAFADGTSASRARKAGVDLSRALARNDAGPALHALGDRIVTGPTGTNVMDLILVLVEPAPPR